MVEKFVSESEMFTSVDIGNAIKKKYLNMDVRNRDVAQWLRENAKTSQIMQDYDSVVISVNDGNNQATLYYPHWTDPEDYTTINQKAFGPNDIDNIKKDITGSSDIDEDRDENSMVDITDVFDDGDQYDPDGTGVKIKRKLKSIERIHIPGDITRALGWNPGDTVDISKIRIHKGKLNNNLKVHYDGRVSIPRRCVGYGTEAIEVILKGNEVYFEKA